jgi:hypothetical protein
MPLSQLGGWQIFPTTSKHVPNSVGCKHLQGTIKHHVPGSCIVGISSRWDGACPNFVRFW